MHVRNRTPWWVSVSLLYIAVVFTQLFSTAYAGVNFNTGNFYMSYTDLIAPDDQRGWPIEVDRTYNSLSPFQGIYGPGWGSTFETYLEEHGGNIIKVYESGCGSVTVYQREEGNSETDETLYRRIKGHAAKILVADSKGYHRAAPLGEQHFNHQGLFTHLTDKQGRSLSIERDSADRIRALVDNLGRRVEFVFDGRNVRQVQLGDAIVRYRYQDESLVESRDTADNRYRYQYDRQNKMTHILYDDGSHLEVRYGATVGKAQYVKSPDGQWKSYVYKAIEPLQDGVAEHYRIESKAGKDDKTLSDQTEEFVKRRDQNNQLYTAKWTRFDGDDISLEIESDNCGIVKRSPQYGLVRYWQYDEHCRTVFYREGDREIRFRYQQDSERVTEIDEFLSGDWIRDISYGYNAQGELLTVTTSEQNWLYRLSWNPQGDVMSFSDEKNTYFMDYFEKGELDSIEFGGRVIILDGPHDETTETRSPEEKAEDERILVSFIKSWQTMQQLIAYANDKHF